MFQYTLAVVDKTVRDVKSVGRIISISTQIIYILYLIYAIIAGIGTLWANIALLCVSALYFAFNIYCLLKLDGEMQTAKDSVRHAYKTVKLAINAVTLAMTLYGIYIAAKEVSVITIVLAGLSTIGWMFSLLLEITVYFFESRRMLFIEALKADGAAVGETITKPVTIVGDFIKKATGHKTEEEKPKPTRKMRILEKLVAKRKARKRNEREHRREREEREKQAKLAEKEEKPKTAEKSLHTKSTTV